MVRDEALEGLSQKGDFDFPMGPTNRITTETKGFGPEGAGPWASEAFGSFWGLLGGSWVYEQTLKESVAGLGL